MRLVIWHMPRFNKYVVLDDDTGAALSPFIWVKWNEPEEKHEEAKRAVWNDALRKVSKK